MTKRTRWIQGGLGAVLTGLGAVASWRVLLPDGGLRSSSIQGWMFMGPALVTVGVLILWTARAADAGRPWRGPLVLFQIGAAFLLLPAIAWTWRSVSGGGLAEHVWNVTSFTLGVPGAALSATGLILLVWRRLGEG